MPATVTPTSTVVSTVASLASTANAGPVSAGLPVDQPGPSDGFAALVNRLAGKFAVAGDDPSFPVLPADAAETEDVLAAVLPFLEALGLTRSNGAAESETEDAAAGDPLATTLTALAAPIGLPAIPAGNPPSSGSAGADSLTAPVPVTAQTNAFVATMTAAEPDAQQAATPAIADFSAQLEGAADAARSSAGIVLGAAAPAQIVQQPLSHALPVSQPVGAPGWDREVGNQIAWLTHQGGGKAELVLTPPQMGRIEVSLTVSGDQATAAFVSANPTVREALEAALPRLREVLAEAGIQLGQAQVGAENLHQQAQQQKNGDNPAADRAPGPNAAIQAAGHALPAAGLKIGRGLVDVFA